MWMRPCDWWLTLDRIVRDQANKTMDMFLQRIRKYSQTLPDSILPPPEIATNANPPRMSTPQNDSTGSTWAGWAISSFTNKLAGASGEIEPKNSDTTGTSQVQGRPASVPPSTNDVKLPPTTLGRPAAVGLHSAPSVPRVSSSLRNTTPQISDESNEDFGGDWSEMDDDTAGAWGEEQDTHKPAEVRKAGPAAFDDQGEPDFAGWLDAQAQAKTKSKTLLLKGLARAKSGTPTSASISPPSRPLAVSNATARTASPSNAAFKVAKPVTSKEASTVRAGDDDDDWGDAWD